MSTFKSLTEASTWEEKKETNEHPSTQQNNESENETEPEPEIESVDIVDCALESDYDMPRNRESLNDLVKNLSFIVTKLKEQIQQLDASSPSVPSNNPPTSISPITIPHTTQDSQK